MEQILLWTDAALNLLLGALLAAAPRGAIAALGLPDARPALYPRVLGGVLLGIGLALALEAGGAARAGLGLAGAIAINLCGAAMLGTVLLMAAGELQRRGRRLLWGVVGLLLGLSAAELAWL